MSTQAHAFDKAENAYAVAMDYYSKPANPNPAVKYLNARIMFEVAAESYKLANKWRQAGKCFALAGDSERKRNNMLEAGAYYVEGGDCVLRADHELAVQYYSQAVSAYASLGRFAAAGYLQRVISEIFAEDMAFGDAAGALQYGADLYMSGDNAPQAVTCLCDAGAYYVMGDLFDKAYLAFSRAADMAKTENLMRYRIPLIMLDACLAMLATGDIPATYALIAKYSVQDNNFGIGRERRFMMHVIECAKNVDVHTFLDHAWNLDYVIELREHQLKVLERVTDMFKAEITEREQKKKLAEADARRRRRLAEMTATDDSPSNSPSKSPDKAGSPGKPGEKGKEGAGGAGKDGKEVKGGGAAGGAGAGAAGGAGKPGSPTKTPTKA